MYHILFTCELNNNDHMKILDFSVWFVDVPIWWTLTVFSPYYITTVELLLAGVIFTRWSNWSQVDNGQSHQEKEDAAQRNSYLNPERPDSSASTVGVCPSTSTSIASSRSWILYCSIRCQINTVVCSLWCSHSFYSTVQQLCHTQELVFKHTTSPD